MEKNTLLVDPDDPTALLQVPIPYKSLRTADEQEVFKAQVVINNRIVSAKVLSFS
jgi:hypothetical protein